LDLYPEKRNDPSADCGSRLSPYLHFGQISPLTIYHSVQSQESAGAERFLEELIVRRELAINYVTYNPRYDTFRGLPRWAQETLDAHAADHREILYTTDELEAGETHDPYWNAAQHELRCTGAMQSYMRMYWGKKILEWSKTGESAFRLAVALNDRYALDGRDPNGYTGIAWCFGTHDRPWRERPVFGKVRYMNTRGLDRKFRMDAYLDRVRTMCASVSREE
jgi:deoxyribodipyrimidine photo-lyase